MARHWLFFSFILIILGGFVLAIRVVEASEREPKAASAVEDDLQEDRISGRLRSGAMAKPKTLVDELDDLLGQYLARTPESLGEGRNSELSDVPACQIMDQFNMLTSTSGMSRNDRLRDLFSMMQKLYKFTRATMKEMGLKFGTPFDSSRFDKAFDKVVYEPPFNSGRNKERIQKLIQDRLGMKIFEVKVPRKTGSRTRLRAQGRLPSFARSQGPRHVGPFATRHQRIRPKSF